MPVAVSPGAISPLSAGYNPIFPLGWQVVGTFNFGNPDQGIVVLKSGLTAGISPDNLISQPSTNEATRITIGKAIADFGITY